MWLIEDYAKLLHTCIQYSNFQFQTTSCSVEWASCGRGRLVAEEKGQKTKAAAAAKKFPTRPAEPSDWSSATTPKPRWSSPCVPCPRLAVSWYTSHKTLIFYSSADTFVAALWTNGDFYDFYVSITHFLIATQAVKILWLVAKFSA